MNNWANAVITNQGIALQAKLIAGTTLTITRAVTGSGSVTPATLKAQTAVSNIQQTMTIKSVTYPEEGKAAVSTRITNDELTTGYTAMQVGFYAEDPDEGEILYFIAQADSGSGAVVPSETEMPGYSAEWTMYFQYGDADDVSVTVDPSNTISAEDAQSMIDEAVGNCLPITGGTLTGNLMIDPDTSYPPAVVLAAEASGNQTAQTMMAKNSNENADFGTFIRDCAPGGENSNYTQILLRRSSATVDTRIQLIDVVDGEETVYNIYGDHNRPGVIDATTE